MDHSHPDRNPENLVGLRYWAPPEHLRHMIGSVYLFTTSLPEYRDLTRADMPQLRFMLTGGGHYQFHGGLKIRTPEVCMLGPTMGATHFHLNSPARVIGISIQPLGWIALGCGEADQWADRLFDMAQQQGDAYADLLDALRAERDPDAAVARIWPFLTARMKHVPDELMQLVSAIDAWLSDKPSPQIEDLVEATGLSTRQIARHTNRLYGAPPKLLARKYRALRCASQIVIDHKGWRELCEEGSFYDQPHFIREIKQFLGLTPHQLLNDPTAVAKLTVQRRAMTGLLSELNRIS